MFNQVILLIGQIDCSALLEKKFFTIGISPRLSIKQTVAHKNAPRIGQTPTSCKASTLHKPERPLAA